MGKDIFVFSKLGFAGLFSFSYLPSPILKPIKTELKMYEDLANVHKVKPNFIFWVFAFSQYFFLVTSDTFKILLGPFLFVFGGIIEDSIRGLSSPDCFKVSWQYP